MLFDLFRMEGRCSLAVSMHHISIPPTFKINEMISALKAYKLQWSTKPRTNHNHAFYMDTSSDFPTNNANYGDEK